MATDLVVTALVPMVPAALSLAGVEPARSIAVVVVTRLLVPTQLPALLQAEALAATDLVVTALVPMVPAALSLAGVEPARSIAVVVVTRLLVPTQLPALLQAEALAATDLVVTALVPMVPAAPSLAGVEPARSIAVVVVITRLLVPTQLPVLVVLEDRLGR